jgi:2,3-bisphosphoglycerate-independent phosphoglycerate mutase
MLLQMVGMLIQNREKYILDLENYIANTSVKLASIVGVITMDRDKRWERIKIV